MLQTLPLPALAVLTGSLHLTPPPAVLPVCLLAAIGSSGQPDLTMRERADPSRVGRPRVA
jgi:hypothetical protein